MTIAQTILVTVLYGFLGAGKSTLINDLLTDPRMADTAIVVNEFGDIGIDHELIRIDQREMMVTTLGCICCTAGSDIRTSLYELHEAGAKEPRLAFSEWRLMLVELAHFNNAKRYVALIVRAARISVEKAT